LPDDCLAADLTEPIEREQEGLPPPAARHRLVAALDLRGQVIELVDRLAHDVPVLALLAIVVDAEVASEAVEPALERPPFLELVQTFVEADEDFLRQILGPGEVVRELVRQVEHTRLMTPHERLPRVHVPLTAEEYQLFVGLHGRFPDRRIAVSHVPAVSEAEIPPWRIHARTDLRSESGEGSPESQFQSVWNVPSRSTR